MEIIQLNKDQTKAVIELIKFMNDPLKLNFLLLGSAGVGKTTVIVNALSNKYKVAFCAFTNKATQVLKNISDKFAIPFQANFQTIHKLLCLEPKVEDNEYAELSFTFDIDKVDYLREYEVIIFDECSTISNELYQYILRTREYLTSKYHDIKMIFLGDFWQLPPVNEQNSVIFQEAQINKWPIVKLSQIMRSKTESMTFLNNQLLTWIDHFRNIKTNPISSQLVSTFHIEYPLNIFNDYAYINNFDKFIEKYITTWKTQKDIVMITYSKSNCDKLNFAVQTSLNFAAERKVALDNDNLIFHVGDRCCIDKPINLYTIKHKANNVYLDNPLNESLYNGEIFDVLLTEDVSIKTPLNVAKYGIQEYFTAQKLTIQRINDDSKIYDVIHIPYHAIKTAKRKFRASCRLPRKVYHKILSDFNNMYPKLTYGYSITIYKAQGSEWNTVLVNLNSIQSSIINTSKEVDLNNLKQLLKATYTAITRASTEAYLFWCKY